MARKAQGHEKAEPTGTVQARRKAAKAQEKHNDAVRAHVVAETQAAHKATEKRLKDKPEDTRTIAPVDPAATL